MKNKFGLTILELSILLSIGLIFLSCEKPLDYSTSWIDYYRYEDGLDATATYITDDTISASINESFLINIRTQSNNGSKPMILRKIDNGKFVDITNISGEATLRAEAEHQGGIRQIHEIPIELYHVIFSRGQIIHYKTSIGSYDGEIINDLFIKIK